MVVIIKPRWCRVGSDESVNMDPDEIEIPRYTEKKLYKLVPAVYRQQDEKIGGPLKALLSIVAEQVKNLEIDIENLYDNWFIETCEDWLVPYIGDLVGARLLIPVANQTISPKAWVANTIWYRKRKGTALVLEQLCFDVTGWRTKVVEFFQILNTTQYLNHIRPNNLSSPNLREVKKLEFLDTPFDTISHTLDVRSIKKGRGYHNIPNIGVFLWRLQAFPVIESPAFDHGVGRYSFNQLGFDMPLFNFPGTGKKITDLAEEFDVPCQISRTALRSDLEKYYGKSFSVKDKSTGKFPYKSTDISICDLSNWNAKMPDKKIAVDPVLGRIAFPVGSRPEDVKVTYHYGFSAAIGGGFYGREKSDTDPFNSIPEKVGRCLTSSKTIKDNGENQIYRIFKINPTSQSHTSITDAIHDWEREGRPSRIFEIEDSEFYNESFSLDVPEGKTITLKSKDEERPVLRAISNPKGESITIRGGKDSNIELDGLLLDKSLRISILDGNIGSITIRHCTLVPQEGISLELKKGNNNSQIKILNSICGKIIFTDSEAKLIIKDSIVDCKNAGSSEVKPDGEIAIACHRASIETSTVFGQVTTEFLELASNSIFTGIINAERRQQGCVRFSYVPEGSRVPNRYHCQPDNKFGTLGHGKEVSKISPKFTSEEYGNPGYAQLRKDIAQQIFEGADNESEMGVFNKLYQPKRVKNLLSSLDEYMRLGLEAGIGFVD